MNIGQKFQHWYSVEQYMKGRWSEWRLCDMSLEQAGSSCFLEPVDGPPIFVFFFYFKIFYLQTKKNVVT